MTLVRRSFETEQQAPGAAAGKPMRRAQQRLTDVAQSRQADKQQLAAARAAIARSRSLLAPSQGQSYATARPQLTDVRAQLPCPPRSQQEAIAAESGDLGKEIATAILRLVPDLIDERGLIFEIADPEPVLRGVASAYAAIARALPGGRDEAWTLWGLLALELEKSDRQPASSLGR